MKIGRDEMDERQLLDGRQFDVHGQVWTGIVENDPTIGANESDGRRVLLAFRPESGTRERRRLGLRLSHALLNDPTKEYGQHVLSRVTLWLGGEEESGRLEVF
jgi:hypothetical protein